MLNNKKIIATITLLLGLGLWAALSTGGTEGPGSLTYETRAVGTGDVSRRVSASGTVDPVTTIEVGSQISGQILALHVDFNAPVTAGQLIAEIDPQTYHSRIRQRAAELTVARANVALAAASLEADKATLAQADRDFIRQETLSANGNASIAMVDNARTALTTSRNRVTMAEAQLKNAEASVIMAGATLEQAEIELARTRIHSPIDGIVIERNIEVGQTVAASLQAPILFRIANNLDEIEIEASVDEADIGNVRAGNAVSFTVDAHPDQAFDGTVREVRLSPTVTQNVVTYTVVVSAHNRGQMLLPGMTANVDITTGNREGVLRVPNDALRYRPRGADTASAGNGPGGRHNMAARMIERLQSQVSLSDDQAAALKTALTPKIQTIVDAGPGSSFSGRERMMNRIRAEIEKELARVATSDQMRAYRSGRGNGARQRTGMVWVQDDDGNPAPVRLRLGLSDDQFTEVLGGALSEGMHVITAARIRRN